MGWLKKSSNGPVTVAFLQECNVALDWQEGVALVLEVAEVFQRSGKRSVPRHENIAVTPSGTVEFLRGRTQSGDAVSALARTLNALLPADRPTQLRLLVSTAGPDSGAYKSIDEFAEALKYFERPGRRNILSAIHHRALEAPVSAPSDESNAKDRGAAKKPPTRRRRRLLVPAMAVLLLAAVAGGAAFIERGQSGSVLDRTEPLQNVASDAWHTALEVTASFRESASRDMSTVLDKMREATGDIVGETLDGAKDDAEESTEAEPASSTRARPAVPSPEPEPDATEVGLSVLDDGEGAVETDRVANIEGAATLASVEVEPVAADPVAATELFDINDVNVTPPVTIRLNLPPVADDAVWNETVGVVEAIVSATGDVEKVKLLSPPENVHQAMILSAIKTWRFRPAELDGLPVRYRQLIPVAVPN